MKLLRHLPKALRAAHARGRAAAAAALLLAAGACGPAAAQTAATPLPAAASPLLAETELALETGAAGRLTIQLPGPAAKDQVYVVTSSQAGVARVPARLTLPAGARSLDIPVEALAPGVSIVRVVANTRQLAATVQVLAGAAHLQAIRPQPATVLQGAQARLRIDLSAVVRNGTAVLLSASPGDALGLPAQATVPAGSRHAELVVTALQAGVHAVHADLSGERVSATLRVTAAAAATLQLLPQRTDIEAGASTALVVQLNGHAGSAVDVTLSASPADVLGLPATLRIPAGRDRAEVNVQALKAGQADIAAQAGQARAAAVVVVRPAQGAAVTPLLALRPPLVSLQPRATGTVRVEVDTVRAYDQVIGIAVAQQAPAAAGGSVVTVPPTVVIPGGQRGASFQLAGVAPGTARLTLRPANSTATTSLEVAVSLQPPQLLGLDPVDQVLPKGSVGQAVLRLAPGGAQRSSVELASDASAVVSVAPAVVLTPGQTEATVALAAHAEGEARISASLNGSQAAARVRVGAPAVEELRVPPEGLTLGIGESLRVPVQALLTDGSTGQLPPGLAYASSQPQVAAVSADGELSALKAGQTVIEIRSGTLRTQLPVTVVARPQLRLSPSATSMLVGSTAAFSVAIPPPAASSAVEVALSYTGVGALLLPARVVVPAGALSATFDVQAASAGSVELRADAPGYQPAVATIAKLQPTLAITGISPARGPAGTVLTLSGSGFDAARPADNRVSIGSVPLEVTAATAVQLVARVPIQAVTGGVSVTNALGTAQGPTFTIEQSQDAGLIATPNSVRLLRGSEATVALAIDSTGTQAYSGSMSLSVSGLPAGVKGGFDPQILPAGRSGVLRLQAGAGVAPGSYQLTITGKGAGTAGSITRTAAIAVNVPDPAQTAATGVRGRFVTPAGLPIAGVIVRADTGGNTSPGTTTDASGGFEFAGLKAGPLTLRFDATPANPLYPIWPFSVNVVADQMLVLKDFVIAPPPETQNYVPINNATQDQKVTDERYPGLEITLPAGAEIVGWDGVKKTRISVEKREISELPVVPPPVPTGAAYQLYFGTPMGGLPSKPIPVTLPNDTGAEPGEQLDVWFFDGSPMGGTGEWKVAGKAVVSSDAKTLKMISGGLTRFCGVCGLVCAAQPPAGDEPGVGDAPAAPPPPVSTPPDKTPPPLPTCPVPPGQKTGSTAKAGNPVNLYSGQQLARGSGLSCAGSMPVNVGRSYNPVDAFNNIGGTEGSIGYGWVLDYDAMWLPGEVKRLVLPGNVQRIFAADSAGALRNTDDPSLDGAVASGNDSGWQMRFKDGTLWRFEPYAGAPGNVRGKPFFLTEIREPDGRAITVSRSSRGQLTAVGTAQRRITATYGSSSFIETFTDPEGRTERYTYTASKRLASVTDPDGRVTSYTYVHDDALPQDAACAPALKADKGERIRTTTYPGLQTPTENHYGSSRRILRQTTANGLEYLFSYRVSGACVTRTDQPGVRCTGTACPTEDSWQNFQAGWRFHGGRVLSTAVQYPDGSTSTTRFGSRGQVLEGTASSGEQQLIQRDAQNRPVKLMDGMGRTGRSSYDAAGNLVRHVDTAGRVTAYTYDARWNKLQTVTRYTEDGTAQTWSYAYDAKGNLTSATDPLNHTVRYGRDTQGLLTSVTDALNHTTRLRYSEAGDLVGVVDALGNEHRTDFDRSGRSTVGTDALGYSTTTQTNGIGLTTQVEDAIGGKTLLAYDEGARLKSVTNPRGYAIASYAYDAWGRLSARTDALGKSDTYTYDTAGRIETTTDRKGQVTRYTYDAAGRVASIELPDRTRTLAYDGAGRVVRIEEPDSRVDFEYDQLDRLVKEVQTNRGVSHEVSYGYDRLDRRVWRKVDGGDETRYEWDLADRLKVIRFAGESTGYEWDAAGKLLRKTLPNGVAASYAYDDTDQLLSITFAGLNGVTIEKFTYAYDARGMRIGKSLTTGGVLRDQSITATYDQGNRMIQAAIGPPKDNCTLEYDLNGNLSKKICDSGVYTYHWDGLNRMVALIGPNMAARFDYDPMGRRTSRTINGKETKYTYDGEQAVSAATAERKTTILTGLSIDEFIATYGPDDTRYMLTDALGSLVIEMQLNRATTATIAYSTYGQSTKTGIQDVGAPSFTGREDDEIGGLLYYRARYYDPLLKQFSSEDPIGLNGGINSYAYVNDSPAMFRDPLGLKVLPGLRPVQTIPGSTDERQYLAKLKRDVVSIKNEMTARGDRLEGGYKNNLTGMFQLISGQEVTLNGCIGQAYILGDELNMKNYKNIRIGSDYLGPIHLHSYILHTDPWGNEYKLDTWDGEPVNLLTHRVKK